MNIVFWSPSKDGQTARNMSILANTFRIYHGIQAHTFHNYEKVCRFKWKEEDLILVDCMNHKNACVRNLLRTADTVVVNFPEERSVLTDYFLERHEILGNVFYLISSSPANAMNNAAVFENLLRLGEEETGEIPYNIRFEERYAQKRGFMYQRSLCHRELYGVEEEFALKTRKIAWKLLKMNCLL